MIKRKLKLLLLFFVIISLHISCQQKQKSNNRNETKLKGKLFVIGGGKRPVSLIDSLLTISEIKDDELLLILPFASVNPKLLGQSAKKQFSDLGIKNIVVSELPDSLGDNSSIIEAINKSKLIYITGGDQNRFMELINKTGISTAINNAYYRGATISGTSAGAALMSLNMISGNEFKHPKYTGEYRSIEAQNIEIVTGLGLLKNSIIDQHFVKRMRMNRLITIAIEHPHKTCIGIDESTAILIDNGFVKVYGLSQVIVLNNKGKTNVAKNGLLNANNLHLQVLTVGESFSINE
ncbi:MAG: cyanophycinase [Bacteroidetes bacterium 4572_77]|nr:MAG: cyanophycinase [Bacteroidetes bacterium 4572_77]